VEILGKEDVLNIKELAKRDAKGMIHLKLRGKNKINYSSGWKKEQEHIRF
jgi:hypothetical protein